jgi:UDP-N-acetyl-D-galactosamine dehydrogenase
VTDIIGQLGDVGITVDVVDPWVGPAEAKKEYDLNLLPLEATLATSYDAVILAVAHEQFMDLAQGFRARLGSDVVLYDVKGKWPRELVDGRL